MLTLLELREVQAPKSRRKALSSEVAKETSKTHEEVRWVR